jgi:hypothetical protein
MRIVLADSRLGHLDLRLDLADPLLGRGAAFGDLLADEALGRATAEAHDPHKKCPDHKEPIGTWSSNPHETSLHLTG